MPNPNEGPKGNGRILVVDDEQWNLELMKVLLAGRGYEVTTASSAQSALEWLERSGGADLILTDALMPGMDGFELCRRLRKDKRFQSIPIILVTALQETSSRVEGLEAGASDFLSKPVDAAELGARIRAHLRIKTLLDEIESWNHVLEQRVEERTRTIVEKKRELDASYFLTIEALIMALDARERETGNHSLRVAFYATEIARKAGIRGRELEEIAMGALLHDIGKIGIPDEVLLKAGALSAEEWIKMRQHPQIGWNIIKDIEFFGKGRDLVLQHQECYDGNGYPQKLKGEDIQAGARLFAVVDALDVLMSERAYKRPMSYEAAREQIRISSGTHFDPKAVELFMGIPAERWMQLRARVSRGSF
ncbi:MAG: HD domain-containing phosphohydrolase [Candidatus Omnitrophota bacterium]|jgi:putative nucleotidyltransferase with HDIG domain